MKTDLRSRILALSLAAASLGAASQAVAGSFDGPWNMVAVTTRGHCGTVDIGLAVNRGRLSATGGFFAFYPISITGRVSTSGHVQLTAIAGPRIAKGTGRFARGAGSGTWKGRGPSGLCSGIWRASRT
jgi:hypothetical protein